MMNKDLLFDLIAELDAGAAELARIQEDNLRAWSRTQLNLKKIVHWEGLGRSLQEVYVVLESYFLAIAHGFDLGLSGAEQSQALITALTESGPEGRPALLTNTDQIKTVMAWEKFRRRINDPEMEVIPGLIGDVQRRAWAFMDAFPAIHQAFVGQLTVLAHERSSC